MFNAQGEPNVTTNHIADELGISPGNLYYHFRNKDDIVERLFARYEARMDDALVAPEDRLPNLEDVWLQLHLVFECMWEYRFLYRDLVDILARNRKLRLRFARILNRAAASAETCSRAWRGRNPARDAGRNPRHGGKCLAGGDVLAQLPRGARRNPEPAQNDLEPRHLSGMMLIAPFLRDAERAHLNTLAQAYRR